MDVKALSRRKMVFVVLDGKQRKSVKVSGEDLCYLTIDEGVILFCEQITSADIFPPGRLFILGRAEHVNDRVLNVCPVVDEGRFLLELRTVLNRDDVGRVHFFGSSEQDPELWVDTFFAGIEPSWEQKVRARESRVAGRVD
jgi:hypothetical protein